MYSIQKDRNHLLVEYLSVKEVELLFYLHFQSLDLFFLDPLTPSLTRFSKRITLFIPKYQL